MVDREKVFDALRNCLAEPKCGDCPWEDCERFGHKRTDVPVTLLMDVLELLRDQEPIEPIVERVNELDRLYRCGGCGAYVLFRKQRYCHACGKKVKWDD